MMKTHSRTAALRRADAGPCACGAAGSGSDAADAGIRRYRRPRPAGADAGTYARTHA